MGQGSTAPRLGETPGLSVPRLPRPRGPATGPPPCREGALLLQQNRKRLRSFLDFTRFTAGERVSVPPSRIPPSPPSALSSAEGPRQPQPPSSRQVGAGAQQGFHPGLGESCPGFHPSQAPRPASMPPSWPLHPRLRWCWAVCSLRSTARVDPAADGGGSAVCNWRAGSRELVHCCSPGRLHSRQGLLPPLLIFRVLLAPTRSGTATARGTQSALYRYLS